MATVTITTGADETIRATVFEPDAEGNATASEQTIPAESRRKFTVEHGRSVAFDIPHQPEGA